MLDRSALSAYEREGFLLLEGFASLERCDALIARAREIVAALSGDSAGPVFSAELQHGTEDEYFLTSGDKIRLFFDAGDPAREAIERVNKMVMRCTTSTRSSAPFRVTRGWSRLR